MGRLKLKAKKNRSQQITWIKLEDGREITDPVEINEHLRADGFTVDELTGRVGLSQTLRDRSRPQ